MIPEDAFTLHRPGGLTIRGETYAEDEKPRRSVVICHGFKGFSHWGFFPHLARAIASAGMRAITFDFSGSGMGDDRETFVDADAFGKNTFTQELADLDAVIEEARRRDWISSPYGLLGHSRGGGVAILHAAANEDVKALTTWAAISYVTRWTPSDVITWRERGFVDIVNARTGQVMQLGTSLLDDVEAHHGSTLDIAAAASRIRVPWLILHGNEDETVPRVEGERLHELSRGSSTLRILSTNHGFGAKHPFDDVPESLSTAIRETLNFFEQYLD
ncbi:MAG: alpha/beta fold hydrolase [Gemmatimonadaceae bacterium]|nr:alpha/beta fold hydrolase [Gemmatimonadaceae bacterium]